jgi:hypothetical protein
MVLQVAMRDIRQLTDFQRAAREGGARGQREENGA